MGGFGDEEVRKQFAFSISTKFRQLSDASEDIDKECCCSDQRSFHQLLKVVGENNLKWRAIVKKEHLGRTKRLKKLFEQRKMRSKPCYRTDFQLISNSGTMRRENRQIPQYRNPRRSHGKSLVIRWIPTIFFLASKVF